MNSSSRLFSSFLLETSSARSPLPGRCKFRYWNALPPGGISCSLCHLLQRKSHSLQSSSSLGRSPCLALKESAEGCTEPDTGSEWLSNVKGGTAVKEPQSHVLSPAAECTRARPSRRTSPDPGGPGARVGAERVAGGGRAAAGHGPFKEEQRGAAQVRGGSAGGSTLRGGARPAAGFGARGAGGAAGGGAAEPPLASDAPPSRPPPPASARASSSLAPAGPGRHFRPFTWDALTWDALTCLRAARAAE